MKVNACKGSGGFKACGELTTIIMLLILTVSNHLDFLPVKVKP